jgi:hypothetical protein
MLTRYGVRLFLTNKRLFFLDADLNRGMQLTAPQYGGLLRCDGLMPAVCDSAFTGGGAKGGYHRVGLEQDQSDVRGDGRYLVLPSAAHKPEGATGGTMETRMLAAVANRTARRLPVCQGMSLDIHFSTIANGWIHQKVRLAHLLTIAIWRTSAALHCQNTRAARPDRWYNICACRGPQRPWWSIFISLAGFVSLAWALYQHYELQIDVEQVHYYLPLSAELRAQHVCLRTRLRRF